MTSQNGAPGRLPDMQPFEEVVTEHGAAVLRVCRAIAGPCYAEDAWSETFLAALAAYPRAQPHTSMRAWLVGIAHHKAVDLVRSQARAPTPSPTLPELPATAPRPGGWESDLWEAIDALTQRQRVAVVGHHIAGIPYAELATLTGTTAAASRRAAADGVAALRRAYQGEYV